MTLLSLILTLEDVEDILKTKEAGNCSNSNESRYSKTWQLFQNGISIKLQYFQFSSKVAFLKLWSADHKWSSGSSPCGPFRLNISPKKTEKIKLT